LLGRFSNLVRPKRRQTGSIPKRLTTLDHFFSGAQPATASSHLLSVS
jgi:hypothetical protein